MPLSVILQKGVHLFFGAADVGQKYQKAQERTEGARESDCALDYDAMLQRLPRKFLVSKPHLRSLRHRTFRHLKFLLMAHTSISEADMDGDMMLAKNTVIFDGYAVPYPSSEIVINYAEWIGPEDHLKNR